MPARTSYLEHETNGPHAGSFFQIAQEDIIRSRFRAAVLPNDFAHVAFLCAETGMGKSYRSKDLLKSLEATGVPTMYTTLARLSSDRAARKVVRIARDNAHMAVSQRERKAVVVDDVPPFDECDLRRVCRAIGRMLERNTFVLVCLRPEAELLVEEFPGAICLRSLDFLDLYHVDADPSAPTPPGPLDIACLRYADEKGHYLDDAALILRTPATSRTLGVLAEAHVRQTLPLEEQRLRLALLLAGKGSVEAVQALFGRVEREPVEWLAKEAPLFGIDDTLEHFCCAGLSDLRLLEECRAGLVPVCARFPEVASAVAQLLANQKDMLRAATVLGLCQPDDLAELGVTWGVELACSGAISLVRKALSLRAARETALGPQYWLARQTLAYLCDPVQQFEERPIADFKEEGQPSQRRRLRLASLARASRDLDRGIAVANVEPDPQDDELARALVCHVNARRLLMSGRPHEAYALLVNESARLRPEYLCNALLCDDYLIAQLLTGEEPSAQELEANAGARYTFKRGGADRLDWYRDELEPMLQVLAGRAEEFPGAEQAAQRAARQGDMAVSAVLLLSSAVLDNRLGVYARAHVRSVQVNEALGPTNEYLLLVARLMDCLAALGVGDTEPLVALATASPASAVRDLALYLARPEEGARLADNLTTLSPVSTPADETWLLNVLSNDCKERSRAFRQALPSAWALQTRRAVRRMQVFERQVERGGGGKPPRSHSEGHKGAEASPRHEWQAEPIPLGARVDISVLGDFSVSVDGRPVPAPLFSRRRAKAYLILLAASKRHSVRKQKVVESIWPESDYLMASQRIYEANSVVRNALRRVGVTLDPLVVGRRSGMVGLDTTVVSCDVDAFERLAHKALSEEDDASAVELACRVVELYQGDVCESAYDARGALATRRRELRSLFVDVAVFGSAAALREKLTPLAVRLARAAYDTGELREDVAMALIEALRASGRSLDAREAYRDFAGRLLDKTNMPPSLEMRASVEGLFPELRGGIPKKRGKKRGDDTISC